MDHRQVCLMKLLDSKAYSCHKKTPYMKALFLPQIKNERLFLTQHEGIAFAVLFCYMEGQGNEIRI